VLLLELSQCLLHLWHRREVAARRAGVICRRRAFPRAFDHPLSVAAPAATAADEVAKRRLDARPQGVRPADRVRLDAQASLSDLDLPDDQVLPSRPLRSSRAVEDIVALRIAILRGDDAVDGGKAGLDLWPRGGIEVEALADEDEFVPVGVVELRRDA